MRAMAIAALATVTMLAPESARAQGDHASHHPAAPIAAMGSASAPAAMGSGSGAPGGMAAGATAGSGMMAGMAGMMPPPPVGACAGGDCETGPSKTPIYPSLMTLPALTPEKHAEIDALATQQITEGMTRLAAGSEALHDATEAADNAAMQRAIGVMRIGLDELGAGVAARRVLFEGKAPRNLALDWFKREMNLASPLPQEAPHGWFGVTPFHLFTMVLLVAFALVMLAMYFFKMRRAAALFGRLEGGPGKPPPGSAPPLTGTGGPVATGSAQRRKPAATGSPGAPVVPPATSAPAVPKPSAPPSPAAVSSPPVAAAMPQAAPGGRDVVVTSAPTSSPAPSAPKGSPVGASAAAPSVSEPRGEKP